VLSSRSANVKSYIRENMYIFSSLNQGRVMNNLWTVTKFQNIWRFYSSMSLTDQLCLTSTATCSKDTFITNPSLKDSNIKSQWEVIYNCWHQKLCTRKHSLYSRLFNNAVSTAEISWTSWNGRWGGISIANDVVPEPKGATPLTSLPTTVHNSEAVPSTTNPHNLSSLH